ncbi:G-protein coupled receptor [Xylaria nigripes]|nr:G-protein coupled receptor [Xylaria nigripes]
MISLEVQHAIAIVERIGSIFSLFGCLFIIVTFLCFASFRNPINRLVFYASFGNLLVNVGTLIAGTYRHRPDSVGCQLQAFLIQQFLPSDALWAFAMSLNVYLTFYFKFDAKKLRALEKWYLLFCYGLPFPPALCFIFISTESKGRLYGDAVLWCWVSTSWDIMRVATFYAPIWVFISATFFIYIRTGREVYKNRSQLRMVDSTDNGEYDLHVFGLSEFKATKTTVITVTSETMAPNKQNSEEDPQSYDMKASSGPGTPSCRSVTISADQRPPAITNSIDEMIYQDQAKGKSKKNSKRANKAAWVYTKYAIIFFTALLVTWLPSSVNRVYSLVHGEDVAVLQVLGALVLPLQGLWNAIIYSFTSWAAVKALFSEFTHRTERSNQSSHYSTSAHYRFGLPDSFGTRHNREDDTESTIGLA